MSPRRFLLSVLLASQPIGLAAQTTVPIGRPNLEYPEAFSSITGVRELADGRVIVADSRERTLQLIDLRTGAVKAIGREGRGPGEFLAIIGLLPQPGDQTLLIDAGNRRCLRLGADGSVVETLGLPRLSSPSSQQAGAPPAAPISSLALLPPRGTDDRGRLYFEPFSMRPSAAPGGDSTVILRWTPGQVGVDSVGWVRAPIPAVVWAPAESWQVAPDGRIIVAKPAPYRIEVMGRTGQTTQGPVVPYTPIRIPEAERKERQDQRDAEMAQTMQMAGTQAGRSGGNAPPAPKLADLVFAEAKPPFDGGSVVAVAPDGQIWVERTRAWGDSIPVFDVFDPAGKLQRRVALPKGSRLLSFGRGTVYLSRKDEDDLEYLQRYAR